MCDVQSVDLDFMAVEKVLYSNSSDSECFLAEIMRRNTKRTIQTICCIVLLLALLYWWASDSCKSVDSCSVTQNRHLDPNT